MNTQVSKKKTSKKMLPEEVPDVAAAVVPFEVSMRSFLMDYLMPFHADLSLRNMSPKFSCADYDLVIEKLGQINTILSRKLREGK